LGAIDALLPELSHWSIDHLSANIPPHVNSPGRVIVNLGGLRVTDAIRDRVLRVARDQESEAVRAIRRSLAANTPVVWVSVRTRNRTADNQRDFIVAACRRIVSYSGSTRETAAMRGRRLSADVSPKARARPRSR
jgi:hypothetical protein